VYPDSTLWQSAEQPSPDSVFPSSHASPGSLIPSPQMIVEEQIWCAGTKGGTGFLHSQFGSIWQVPLQQSPGRVFPSSQVSPVSTMPSPQYESTLHDEPGDGQV
jgi:hypothetical protein